MNWVNSKFITDNKEIHVINYEWRPMLRDNYKAIRDEYTEYCDKFVAVRYSDVDFVQKRYDTGDKKWLVVILKEFGTYTKNIDYFPKTYKLLKDIPGCTHIMFSAIEPGKCIQPHNGIYNGVLRYHLALITDPDNCEQCYLVIGKYKYIWREGEDIIFDDMFLHFAYNNANTTRVVLFLDIMRDFENSFINFLNATFIRVSEYNQTKKDIIGRINTLIEEKAPTVNS